MGGWGGRGVLAPDCTPRLLQPAAALSRSPTSPRPKSTRNPERPGEPPEGVEEGGFLGRRASHIPEPAPPACTPPPFLLLARSSSPGSAARPRAGALWAEAARAAARGWRRRAGRRGEGAGARARAGSGLLRKQPREGILGAGPAPSRARGAGPRASRVTGRPSPAATSAAAAASTRGREAAAAAGAVGPGMAAGKSALCSHPSLPPPHAAPEPPALEPPPLTTQELGTGGCGALWWPGFGGGRRNSVKGGLPSLPTLLTHPSFREDSSPSEEPALDLNLSLACWGRQGERVLK